MDLTQPLAKAGFLYKLYAKRLAKLNMFTVEDLLFHIPFRYEDFSHIVAIKDLVLYDVVTIQGTIEDIRNIFTKGYKKIQKAVVTDDTGSIAILWFNQPFIPKALPKGSYVSLAGRVEKQQNKLVLVSPHYEILSYNPITKTYNPPLHTGRLVPIYNETKGISSKWFRQQIFHLLTSTTYPDYIPSSIQEKEQFLPLAQALFAIHFPTTLADSEKAKERLSFNEFFLLHLTNLLQQKQWEEEAEGILFSVSSHTKSLTALYDSLPFQLTTAQKNALSDIFSDMQTGKPMNRLLQGDVGSGKTIVAAIAMYLCVLEGYHAMFMAPTEILALQHYTSIRNILSPFGIDIGIMTSKQKEHLHAPILVGTHALLHAQKNTDTLGLVIIDEQQRFGVSQRGLIRQKGKSPHVLTMTATPIPRTIALTLYGNLKLCVLDEMPKGRHIVKTWLVPENKRDDAYQWISKEIQTHKTQAFLVCPFIEESESMQTVKAVKKEFGKLQEIFGNLRLGLLHGKLSSKEKQEVLASFQEKKIDILVATPVVEVGIDIPNATIIVIEAAERFGLAQLHQLRGRVGRGEKQSYCLLFTETTNPQTITRLKALETMHVGAVLAEFDFKLRGPGDIYGTRQHGQSVLRVASFSNASLIQKTRQWAEKIMPFVAEYPLLQEKLTKKQTEVIAPD